VYAGGKVLFHPSKPAAPTLETSDSSLFFSGQFGVRFSFLPPAKQKRRFSRNAVNVFLEYSAQNAFSVGISLPAGGLSYVINDWLDILNAEIKALIPSEQESKNTPMDKE
jgi:hypothetical protein